MRKLSNHQYQNGVVLFIALIALVVMSLAAAALIRSVDTNATIAGNLSFQQSALISAGRGGEAAITWLGNNASNLNGSLQANGYYANYGNLMGANVNLDDATDLRNDDTWNDYSASAGTETDTKNQIDYIIERMCSTDGAVPANDATNKCLFGASEAGGGSKGVKTAEQAGAQIQGGLSPLFRVTIRVTGPRNTQNYSQLYVY